MVSDAEERARFDAWWLGDYGPYGIRAEFPSSQTEAAWMAWKAQAEKIERQREALRGVIRVADRKTVEFDAAHAALNSKGETK